MRFSSGVVVLVVVLLAPLGARAQTVAAPAPPAAPAQAAPPAAAAPGPAAAPYDPYAPPAPYAQPAPYGAQPAPYPAPGYGYGYGGPLSMQLMAYESNKKSSGLALVLDLLLPGVGSIYAEHAVGAALTWGGMIGGVILISVGLDQGHQSSNASPGLGDGAGLVIAGFVAILGSRIYGLVDAYSSANDYNTRLARTLRLPPPWGLSLAPVRTQAGATALAPTFTLRF